MDSRTRVDCYHCGLPVLRAGEFVAELGGEPQEMCCPGCVAVATLIADSGLDNYYQYRTGQALKAEPAAAAADRAAAFEPFDNPDVQRDFVQVLDAGVQRAQLAVDGIHCAACVWLLESYLEAMPGVNQVTVHLAERRAAIDWQPGQIQLSQLMAAIQAIGYRPRPYQPATTQLAIKAENRQYLRRLGVAGLVMMQIGMFAIALYAGAFQGIAEQYQNFIRWVSLLLALPVVGYSAVPFFQGAWRGIVTRHPGMDLPVALAIALAFVASAFNTVRGTGEVYFDSVAMFTFFLLLGRYLEQRTRYQAELAGAGLMSLVPSAALRINSDGRAESVPLNQLQSGDRVRVHAGDYLPCDGQVLSGVGGVDESSLTGESHPVTKRVGDRVTAGTRNGDAALDIEVSAVGFNSRLGSIMQLVDRVQEEKPRSAQLADRLASGFVLVVIGVAALAALYWAQQSMELALAIALAVLVVSCPCALSLATPAALTAAVTALRKRGFVVSRGHALDTLARVDLVVFDKTGTLTTGAMRVDEVRVLGELDADRCRQLAASLEAHSAHPIARALASDAGDLLEAETVELVTGQGVSGMVEGVSYRVGTAAFAADDPEAGVGAEWQQGKWVFLGHGDGLLAAFRLTDSLRDSASGLVGALQQQGLAVALLSGDCDYEVARVANTLNIETALSKQSPEQKLAWLQRQQQAGRRVLMVGDGINDMPVLAGADVSVAMAEAADVTKTQADCLLLNSDLQVVDRALGQARSTRTIIRQNVAWALAYNLAAMPLAALGWVPPWAAAIGMSASSLVVVANALRLRR